MRYVPIIPSSKLRIIGKAWWQADTAPDDHYDAGHRDCSLTAGPAKTAIQAARDALATHMTMFINDSELQWRYICSRTFVKP